MYFFTYDIIIIDDSKRISMKNNNDTILTKILTKFGKLKYDLDTVLYNLL